MKDLDLYTAKDFGDDMWFAYRQYKAQVYLNLERDQAEHLNALEKMVREEAPYYKGEILDESTGMTDFDYLSSELEIAKDIYCMGVACTDPGQDGPGKLIGMLDRNFNKMHEIHLNTQDWLEKAAGEGGWMERIASAQSRFGGKEGTEDASAVYDALVKFRDEKDNMLRIEAAESLDKHIANLGKWVDLQSSIKIFDLPNAEGVYDDDVLNFAGPNDPNYEENLNLFKAVERMRVGDIKKAEEYHDIWTKGYAARKKEDRRLEKEDATRRKNEGIAKDAIIEKAWTDHDTNVRGAIEALDGLQSQAKEGRGFDSKFVKSVQWYMPAIDWDKGSLNMNTVKERKGVVADNLTYWLDNNAWGDAYDDWQYAVKHARKIHVDPDTGDPLYADTIMKRLALEFYMLNKSESDVLNLAKGGQGMPWMAPFVKGEETLGGFGELFEREGMDFHGYGLGEDTPEEAAEDYFVQTWKVWNALNSAENDPVLQAAPEGLASKNLNDPDGILGSNANPANTPKNPDTKYIRNEDVPGYNAFIDSLDNLARGGIPEGYMMFNGELVKKDIILPSDTTMVNPDSLGPIMGDSTAIDTDVPGSDTSTLDYDFVMSHLDKPGGKAELENMATQIAQFVANNPDSFPGNAIEESKRVLNDWSSLPDSLRQAYGKGTSKEEMITPLADFIISNYITEGE